MKISIIIVAYNSEKTLEKTLESIKKQSYSLKLVELILVDSLSFDATKNIMRKFEKEEKLNFLDVKILDNTTKRLPSGINLAIRQSVGDIILRIDAHAEIPSDYLEKNVKNIRNGEKISGGIIVNKMKENLNFIEKMIVLAENSMFGGSIAKFRRKSSSGYVKTLAFACYSRAVFDEVGLYDERLLRTEDNDIHYRMRKAGYKFYLDKEIIALRQARDSVYGIVKQKYLNGYWIGLSTCKTLKMFEIYHYIPFLFVSALIFSLIFACFFNIIPFLIIAIPYIVVLNLLSIKQIKKMNLESICLPFFLAILHISYGLGTIIGFLMIPFWKEKK